MAEVSVELWIKVLLVPAFLFLVTIIGKLSGPQLAGWLAGLPLVTGPILFVLALENGNAFASVAATSATAAIVAAVSFAVVYARAAQRTSWPLAWLMALLAWFAVAFVLTLLPGNTLANFVLALVVLLVGPRAFPVVEQGAYSRTIPPSELLLRMAAGAALTVAVSGTAHALGGAWSGVLSVFPVLSSILAVFSHRSQGATFTATLLRGLVAGLYSAAAFSAVFACALQGASLPLALVSAVGACLAVQAVTLARMKRAR